MKKPMRGRVFNSHDEVIAAANDSLRTLPAKFWEEGMDKILQRYENTAPSKGEYVEHTKRKEDDSLSDESDDKMILQAIFGLFLSVLTIKNSLAQNRI